MVYFLIFLLHETYHYITITLLALWTFGFCQNNNPNAKDTSEVIRIVKEHHAYFKNSYYFPPKLNYDSIKNEWTIECKKLSYTKEGICAHTNGCSTMKTVKITIEWKYKTVMRRTEEISLLPNYNDLKHAKQLYYYFRQDSSHIFIASNNIYHFT